MLVVLVLIKGAFFSFTSPDVSWCLIFFFFFFFFLLRGIKYERFLKNLSRAILASKSLID